MNPGKRHFIQRTSAVRPAIQPAVWRVLADVGLDLVENSKATVQAKCSRLGYIVVLSLLPQDEQPWLAGCW